MLYSVDSRKYVKTMPHKREFNGWMNKLSQHDYDAIVSELNSRIDGTEIKTSSWIPGKDWTNTIFQPIYIAVGHDIDLAGLFFGLILFNLMQKRQDVWGFGRYVENNIQVKGMTYFLLKNPPAYK